MSLSQEQRSAIEQLSAITASSTDAARARDERMLRENGWNVQATIEQIFSGASASDQHNEPAATSSSSSASLRSPTASSPTGLISGSGPDRAPVSGSSRSSSRPSRVPAQSYPTPGHGQPGLSVLDLVLSPFRLALGFVSGVWYFLIRNVMPISFLRHLPPFLRPPSIASNRALRQHQDPTANSLAYIRELEVLTGCSAAQGTLPELYIGPYREFLNNLRKEGRVGMVLLTCAEHEDDVAFKREVLADGELVRFLKEKDISVWAADIRSREGCQVAGTLLATTYPSMYFISLLPSNGGSAPKLAIISNLAGSPSTSTSSGTIIQTLTTSVLPRTSAFLARMKRERSTLEEARHLREEQDRAFRAAEARDREKMRVQREKEEEERMARWLKAEQERRDGEERQRAEESKAKEVENRARWRRYARKHLLSPPSTASAAGSIRVALRTPLNADRNVRQFQPGPSTEELYIYAETLLIPPSDPPASDPDSPPAEYSPPRDFVIVTSFPRKEVARVERGGEEVWNTIKQAGGALFAEKIEGSKWGEAERGGDGDSDEDADED